MTNVWREAQSIASRYAFVSEACASVAMSHPAECPCIVCRAAHGDLEAIVEVTLYLERDTGP